MRKLCSSVTFLAVLLVSSSLAFAGENSPKKDTGDIEIPFTKFVLDNGLRLIVHEDRKAPIVAVNIWYHVGSKNEKPGKSGFAHLFEHLMFNGSENFNDDYFQALERVGATDLNGTTNPDRTNYFQNVPTPALDLALWMESDRMGHLLGAIDQGKLDEQRGVVQNEKRQGENQPYGLARELITKGTYPPGHPYSWTTIGSMEDLNAAALEDVHEWFKQYYGAANAVVVVAGDIDAETARAKVEKYFGDIPSGPPVGKHQAWIAKMEGSKRQVAEDRVPQSRVQIIWNVPQWGTDTMDYLDLVSDVLGQGKNSRFYKRLVYQDQIAINVAAYINPREISGQFYIQATAKPGGDLKAVEKALREELASFVATGPTADEVERVKTQYRARFIRGIERIGGFGGKSDILATNEVYGGDPGFYKTTLKRHAEATAADLHAAAKEWLTDGEYVLEIHPFPKYKTAEAKADRSKLPDGGTPPSAKFPTIQKATLSNGLKVMLAERSAIPVVEMRLIFDAGYAADQFATPGTSNFTMAMLDEGTKKRTSLQISDELAKLGATLNTGSDLDVNEIGMSALKEKLAPSLDILADVVMNPAFPEADFNRLQKQLIAGIQREKVQPVAMALRVFPKLLYGKDHAYGNPYTGSGTEATVGAMTRDDLKKFHKTWIRPNNATLVVVGAASMSELQPMLDNAFKGWKKGDAPKKNIGMVEHQKASKVYLIDKPGSIQSIIFAGHVAVPKNNPDEFAIETMNTILGGSFTSRVNMNLREDKGWAYGARTLLLDAQGQRPLIAYAPVQSDKTSESMAEIMKEFTGYIGENPATANELEKVQKNRVLRLPGQWETNGSVAASMTEMVQFGYADNYFDTYGDKVKGLNLAQVQKAAKKVLKPNNVVWVVVGDRAKIEEGVKALNFGEIAYLDADGNPVE